MSWEVRLGSCLDPVSGLASLADGSVDLMCSDAPYEGEAHTKGRRIKVGKGTNRGVREAPLPFAAMTEETRVRFAAESVRVCQRWSLVFGQIEALHLWRGAFEATGRARYIRTLLHVKSNPQPQLTGDRPGVGYEACFAFWCGKPADIRWNGGGRCGVYYAVSEWGHGRPAPHPTTKPIDLMRQIVRDFSDHGNLVIDGFAGSGTTIVAARQLGRRGIGWEIDPGYHAKALGRVGTAREQLGLWMGAA
jgi:site-specific DNA-methyltransferase (adenine-specific)